jgi:hypothetical protein
MSAPASFHALDLITDAYTEIGVASEGYTLSGSESSLGLQRLNSLIDRKGTNRLTIYKTVITDKALSSGTQTYTIGSGGAINVVRPLWIPYAGIVQTSGPDDIESPLYLATEQDWSNQGIKTLGNAIPSMLYYDYNWSAGLAQITLWPVPDSNLTLRLYLPTAVTQFADLSSTTYTFPPGYYEWLMYQLAERLWTPFHIGEPVPADLRRNAALAEADIKRANIRLSTAAGDPGLFQGGRRGLSKSAFLSGQF